ncbi:MAG: 3-deoxy-D-manno-octulosonic acid transferase [Nitrospira bacterium HGW-Nitrospira-1]|nr:MAG: 3-deoxy-D-manno-octulosonic acid transferase [Nitrospira bacterium HGW-Nitrospira-1]
MFFLYSILYTLAIFLLFIPQCLKRPKELRWKWVREKLGRLSEMEQSIWVHAVSVGEVNAAIQLLIRLRKKYPDVPIVLSTITDTGQKVASDKAPEGVRVVYLPFDIHWILNRSFRRVKPKILIVIETELWPNIFRLANKRTVPVIILNGRISEKSSQGYKKISFFMKRVFSYVAVFGMQSRLDAERLKAIGADEKKVQVSGNFKFDMEVSGKMPAWTAAIKGPVIVAGSTHRGEEELVISAYLENLGKFPDLMLILAPRHPERFREVAELLRGRKVPFVKRSELGNRDFIREPFKEKVLLLDSVGELSSVYGIADIAVVGKSFIGIGGQNPLEPAYWGKPILCGPHMENFPFMQEFYDAGAAFEVEPSLLAEKIGALLAAPDIAKAAGEKAGTLYASKSGAVVKALEIIEKYIHLN